MMITKFLIEFSCGWALAAPVIHNLNRKIATKPHNRTVISWTVLILSLTGIAGILTLYFLVKE